MSLKLIATPIGDPGDITLRAIEALKASPIVIGEERREVSTLLKRLGFEDKDVRLLNEHSSKDDLSELLGLCREHDVALVTDCGTPGFCDPGARLVDACRKAGVSVTSLPGASSLMSLISLAALETREFYFAGFPPAEREARTKTLMKLVQDPGSVVLMDTPYRLSRLMQELALLQPDRRALLGMDLTSSTESVLEGTLSDLSNQVADKKAEFMLLLYAFETGSSRSTAPRATSAGARVGANVGPRSGPGDLRRPARTRKFTPGRRR